MNQINSQTKEKGRLVQITFSEEALNLIRNEKYGISILTRYLEKFSWNLDYGNKLKLGDFERSKKIDIERMLYDSIKDNQTLLKAQEKQRDNINIIIGYLCKKIPQLEINYSDDDEVYKFSIAIDRTKNAKIIYFETK